MNAQSKAAQAEQNPIKTINDLHQAFANLAFSYGIVNRVITDKGLAGLEWDCEKLIMISQEMRLQAKVGVK